MDWFEENAPKKKDEDWFSRNAPGATVAEPDPSTPWYERAFESAKAGEIKDALSTVNTAATHGVRRALNLPLDRPPTWDELKEVATNAIDQPLGPGGSSPAISTEDVAKTLNAVGLQGSPTKEGIRDALSEAASGLTTPNFATTLPAYELRAVRAAAALRAAPQAYSETTDAIRAAQAGDEAGAAKHGTQGIISAAMALALGKSTLPERIKATLSPERVPQMEPQPEAGKVLEKPPLTPQAVSVEQSRGTLQPMSESESAKTQILPVSQESLHGGMAEGASADAGATPEIKRAALRLGISTEGKTGAQILREVRSASANTSPELQQAIESDLALPGTSSSLTSHDFRPAIRTETGIIPGENGQTHNQLIEGQPDPTELMASDPERLFVDKAGKEYTREQVSAALGETEPMQSERLAELQQAQPESQLVETGIANRILETENKAGKIGEIEPGEGISWQDSVTRGRELLIKGADPQQIARRIQNSGRLNADDMAILRAERERLHLDTRRIGEQAEKDPQMRAAYEQAKTVETEFIRNAVQPAKTMWHKMGMATQGEAPIDASTFQGLRKVFVDSTNGREPTPMEARGMEKHAREVRTRQKAEQVANERLTKSMDKSLSKTKVVSLEELRAEMQKMADELLPCNL